MFAGQLGDFGLPTDGRPDALVFVQRDRDAVRTAAQRDAPGQFALFDRVGQRVGIVRIIDAFGTVRAEIIHVVPFRAEVADQELLEFISGVVAGDAEFVVVHIVEGLLSFGLVR